MSYLDVILQQNYLYDLYLSGIRNGCDIINAGIDLPNIKQNQFDRSGFGYQIKKLNQQVNIMSFKLQKDIDKNK